MPVSIIPTIMMPPSSFLDGRPLSFLRLAQGGCAVLSYLITEVTKNEDGKTEGTAGCIVGILNIGMIICGICSFYLLVPLAIIYLLFKHWK